jgi:hypothetical protein
MSVKVNDPIEQLPTLVVAFDLRSIVACLDESYAETKQQWINNIYSLHQQLQKEIEKVTVNDVSILDAKREAIVIKLKAARAAFDEMNGQAAFFQSSERELSRQANQASFAVRLKRDSPLTPAYATKADIAQWESELNVLESAESEALRRYHSHTSLQSMWVEDCKRLKAVHDNLAVEEAELRHRLEHLRGIVTGPQKTSIGLSA